MMVRQDQGQVKVMGEEGMEMMVDISNIKSADMPLEALNKSKEDMIKSFHLHHGEQTDDVHLPHGEGGKAPSQQVSPVKHLPVTKILDVKEDIHAKDSEDSPEKMSQHLRYIYDPQPTPACGLPPPTASALARPVFTPTATLTQHVVTDIINIKKMA